MKVLISIQQPVAAWQIPADRVERLRARFPDVSFLHATDNESRSRGLIDCDVVYTWILSTAELATASRLRWVHTSAVAVETLPLADLFARHILVSNSRGVQSTAIAEHVLAVILALAKGLPLALKRQSERHWAQHEFSGDRLPWLLRGRTLGLLGVGTIGSQVARLAKAFGMHVVAARRRALGDPPAEIDELIPASDLDGLLGRADVIVVAAPLTPETQNLFGASQFARMKRGALFVNVGRAKIVDHGALIDALVSGHLGGAALDVFPQEPLPAEHPLWTAPNLVLTPHTSGFRHGHWDDVIEVFAKNLERFSRDEPLSFQVQPSLGY